MEVKMGRSRGRSDVHRLADMAIYPRDDCYEPPPRGQIECLPASIDLDEGHRLGMTRYYRRGTSVLVYFGINQSVRLDEGDGWRDVARIDCSHQQVHRHQFTRSGLNQTEVLEAITSQHGEEIINRWYGRAMHIMLEEWPDNLRRWEG
jgi:hypothetical protein